VCDTVEVAVHQILGGSWHRDVTGLAVRVELGHLVSLSVMAIAYHRGQTLSSLFDNKMITNFGELDLVS
jgi:hypothetical protein